MKSDRYRLQRLLEIGAQLQEVIARRGITASDIENDIEVQWLVTTPLFNIGEQANCLSEAFTSAHPEVPWTQIAGLRHRLVHHYEGTNWSLISSILLNDISPLIGSVREILAGEDDLQAGEATSDTPKI